MKALNERISEWAHFSNLAKRLQRYLSFSAPKNRVFREDLEGSYISEMAPKRRFLKGIFGYFGKILEGYFCNFLGINTHNFVKKGPKFDNKGLFDAKFYGS